MTSAVPPLNTISLDLPPRWVAITPDGRRAYVTMDDVLPGGDPVGAVAVIDTGSDQVAATIAVGMGPGDVAVAPDGRRVYVSSFDRSRLSGVLTVIDTASDQVVAAIAISGPGGGPKGVAVGPDGRRVYVCHDHVHGHERGGLSVIDTEKEPVTISV
ncbi:hypothetical protein [Alloactinosynnema sp. L-07]|uniref:YncE family protein n=1 Tax=Alloactinosynnema sp. L-07 TaxID=1653480 RepID=UPI00065EF398|nr:YncE family protein [Alloactinosynnema sp. L-07]CRK56941.1 hypothetical protein [Alloactinosynnema sp. L-07]